MSIFINSCARKELSEFLVGNLHHSIVAQSYLTGNNFHDKFSIGIDICRLSHDESPMFGVTKMGLQEK